MNPSHRKSPWRHAALSMALFFSILFSLVFPALAAEVPASGVQALSSADFDRLQTDRDLTGVFITGVPGNARLCLGSRVIAAGDVLSTAQLSRLTLEPGSAEAQDVLVSYLPIYGSTVEQEAVLTVSLKGSKDLPPEVKDGSIQTYKNLQNTGRFDAQDPEGSELTFTITRQPHRGTVTVQEDGSFLFTPKKNKVGKDYFTYTATDADGKTSSPATVKITVTKAKTPVTYADLEREAVACEPFRCFIDPDDPRFGVPGNLPRRVQEFCAETNQYVPQTRGEIMRCIYESLAMKYRYTFCGLRDVTGQAYGAIHMIGGGTKDRLLCQMTADSCSIPVVAGPIEATAMGNIAVQLMALGVFADLKAVRRAVAQSEDPKHYAPQNTAAYDAAYDRFVRIVK